MCATSLKPHTEFCALYCPTPPPTPSQRTTHGLQPVGVVGATQATTLPNEERIGPRDETWFLNLSEGSTGISSRGETSAPERSLTTLVGAVVIGLVTLAGAVIVVVLFCWRKYKGDPVSMSRTFTAQQNLSTLTESNISTNNIRSVQVAREDTRITPVCIQHTIALSEAIPLLNINRAKENEGLNEGEASRRQKPETSNIALTQHPAILASNSEGIHKRSAVPELADESAADTINATISTVDSASNDVNSK